MALFQKKIRNIKISFLMQKANVVALWQVFTAIAVICISQPHSFSTNGSIFDYLSLCMLHPFHICQDLLRATVWRLITA